MRLPVRWRGEATMGGVDGHFGAKLTQMTTGALVSHDIYCEERYATTDGTRFAVLRSACGRSPEDLWLVDIERKSTAPICEKTLGYPSSNLYRDTLFYIRSHGEEGRVLVRLDMRTLEQEDVFNMDGCPKNPTPIGAISPDERYFVTNIRVSEHVWGLYRIDLERGAWEMFHEHEDICNPHPQFEPSKGQDIMVQHNRGCTIDMDNNITEIVGPMGAALYVIDRDGGNLRTLPVGQPITGNVSGHECWIADTGDVLLTTQGPIGHAVHRATPGAEQPQLLWRGMCFGHISTSSDGKYFLTDDLANDWQLYLGSLETGRMLPLLNVGGSQGIWSQHLHPHAYILPGNRHVVFNSDRTGLAQVWIAEIPPLMLQALDTPAV